MVQHTPQQTSTGDIGLGMIGLGGFGHYALEMFAQVDGVRPVCIAGTHREASVAAAKRFSIPDVSEIDELLTRDDVHLAYISTPPFLHYEQGLAALDAGKHVIVEKPLALTVEQADEMIRVAHRNDRLLVANLMQRYNPMYDMVGRLIESRALGEVLHGYFENYASDEALGPEHWFWDRQKSGGIFIEHAVHFFDLFEGWLGEGDVVCAQASTRPENADVEEQVQCTVRYRDGIHVTQYHGFTQPARLDRQELRLLFERGDVTLEEWVPVRARIRGVADEADTRTLMEIFRGARLDIDLSYTPRERQCQARHKSIDVYQRFELEFNRGEPKYHRYGQLLRSMMQDQVAWIRDRSHQRTVTEINGRNSLAMAAQADWQSHAAERAATRAAAGRAK